MKMTVALALVCVTVGLSVAQESDAAIKQYDLNIPRQTLDTALKDLAQQTGLQIARFTDNGHGSAMVGPVQGAATAETALDSLLAPTGLTYRVVNERTIAVMAPGSGAPVVAAGSAEGEGGSDPGNARTAGAGRTAQNRTAVQPSQESQTNERESEREKRPIEEIVVTGTSIRGGNSASPTIVIDRNDIERWGIATVQQLIDRLPQQFSGSASENTIGSFTGSAESGFNISDGSGLDIRGLGPDSSLVLINGRRVAATGIGNFVDLSLIPLSAVERVEIVTDGASAIYGSDAVGGVANFILRDDFDGAGTLARIGTVTKGESREYQFGQLVGTHWSSGNVLASYEYYKRTDLDANDRSYTKDTLDPFDLLPDQERHSVFVTVNQAISDSVALFADGLYARRESRGDINQFDFPDVAGATTEQMGFTAGSRIDLGRRWQLEARGTYDHNDTDQRNSEGSDFTGNSYSADIKADGPLFHIGGGNVRIALGGQYRREEIDRKRPPESGLERVHSKRTVQAAFAEVLVPLVGPDNGSPGLRRLELTAAGRFDDYSDSGGTFNPKFGLLWSPVNGLKLRGSHGTAFKAPLLFDLDDSGGLILPFPASDPDSPTGVTNVLVLNAAGNAELEPEKAKTLSFGFDFSSRRLPGLYVSANFFKLDFKNRIANPPLGPFLSLGLAGGAGVDPFVTRNVPPSVILDFASRPEFVNPFGLPIDTIDILVNLNRANLSETRVRGIDGNIRYHFTTDAGRFDLGLAATHLIDHKTQFTGDGEFEELVNTRFNPVNLVATGSLGWSRGSWVANVFVNYTDSYKDPTSVAGEVFDIDSWTTADLALQYDTGASPSVPALRNLRLGINILNVFDTDPPFVRNADLINFDGANANALGRFVSFQGTKKW